MAYPNRMLKRLALTACSNDYSNGFFNGFSNGLHGNHLYARLCRLLPQGRKNLNCKL